MKIRVGVFFGGQSVEHEVSIISAQQAISSMNKDKYEIIPVYISKDSKMYTGENLLDIKSFTNIGEAIANSTQISLINENNQVKLVGKAKGMFKKPFEQEIDVAFPVVHGCNVEDGTIQGLFEILNIAYVGCDVYSSSLCMDKYFSKAVLKQSNLSVLDAVQLDVYSFTKNTEKVISDIENRFGYPVIVKPVNQGSSVGISVAKNVDELKNSLDFAFTFSAKVIVEKALTNMMEVNCSVLGDLEECFASILEEPVNNGVMLSYEDKYLNGGSKDSKVSGGGQKSGMASLKRIIPARISDEMATEIKSLAIEAFKTLGCSGVVRIDFIIDKDTDTVYINEFNTIPGSLSFYLWEKTDKPYTVLLDDLIKIALKKKREKNNLKTTFETNILSSFVGGTKGAKN